MPTVPAPAPPPLPTAPPAPLPPPAAVVIPLPAAPPVRPSVVPDVPGVPSVLPSDDRSEPPAPVRPPPLGVDELPQPQSATERRITRPTAPRPCGLLSQVISPKHGLDPSLEGPRKVQVTPLLTAAVA